MDHKEDLISVVVPLPDDADHLAEFVAGVLAALQAQGSMFELIFIDDGCPEPTVAAAHQLLQAHAGVRLIRLSRRFGSDVAIMAGLESAIGDLVVVMNPDSDPPAEIERLVELARSGVDVSLGVAANPLREGALFRLCRASFYLLYNQLLRLDVPPAACTLFGLTRRAVNAITRLKQKQRHLAVLSCAVGFPRRIFRYHKVYRTGPPRGRGILEALPLGISLLVRHSRAPLRLVTGLGCLASLVNLLYVVYVVAVNLLKHHVVEGWTTISLQNSLMFMFIFLILVLMSECVSRILDETGGQPLYHVLEESSSSVTTAEPSLRNVVYQAAPLGNPFPDEEKRNAV